MSMDVETLNHRRQDIKTTEDLHVDPGLASENNSLYDEDERQLVWTLLPET